MALDPTIKELTDIVFTYVPNPFYTIRFGCFLESLEDTFDQTWNSVEVYGRQDSIEIFKNTKRAIHLSWTVPSVGPAEGLVNLAKLQSLIKTLYPVYEDHGDASTISHSPLLRLRLANLIANPQNSSGLLGHVDGFKFAPRVSEGFYTAHPDAGQYLDLERAVYTNDPSEKLAAMASITRGGSDTAVLIPKIFDMSCTFKVIHEQALGHRILLASAAVASFGGASGNNKWPYGTPDEAILTVIKERAGHGLLGAVFEDKFGAPVSLSTEIPSEIEALIEGVLLTAATEAAAQ